MRFVIFAVALASSAFADPVAVSDFARAHGLAASRDSCSGRDILKGASTVILAPGMAVALVNGRLVSLNEDVRVENGRTVMSEGDASKLAGLLRDDDEEV